MCKTEICRNWENGYCQYGSKVSFKLYFISQQASATYVILKQIGGQLKLLFLIFIEFSIILRLKTVLYFEFSALSLTVVMNCSSGSTSRKTTRRSYARNSTVLSTTVATGSAALSYTHGLLQPFLHHIQLTAVVRIVVGRPQSPASQNGSHRTRTI